MCIILAHPIGQSLILPFSVSILCALLIQFFLNDERGTRWAVLAIAAGTLVGYVAILGLPPFPPRVSSQKFFYIVAFAIIVGITLKPSRNISTRTLFFLTALGVVTWFAGPTLTWRYPEAFVPPILLIGVWLMTLQQFDRFADRGLLGLLVLIFGATGIAITAGLGNSASIAQLALAIVSAATGFCFLVWRNHQFRFDRLAIFTGVVPLLALISQLVLFGGGSIFAMLPLLGLLFVDQAIAYTVPSWKDSTLAIGMTCLLPLAITAVLALHLEASYDPYGYLPVTPIAHWISEG